MTHYLAPISFVWLGMCICLRLCNRCLTMLSYTALYYFCMNATMMSSCWNWEDELGKVSGPTAVFSLCNPRFVLPNLAMANWITQQMFLYAVLMYFLNNNTAKYLCGHANWIGFLDRGVCTTYYMHTVCIPRWILPCQGLIGLDWQLLSPWDAHIMAGLPFLTFLFILLY